MFHFIIDLPRMGLTWLLSMIINGCFWVIFLINPEDVQEELSEAIEKYNNDVEGD